MSSNTQYGYKIPLADRRDGVAIAGSGGSYMVCQAGTGKKQAIYNKGGTQLNLTTPFVALSNGLMEFYVPDTVVISTGVDIYGMAPDGQFFVRLGVSPSGPNQILVDRERRNQVALIPFALADSVAATEKDTGLDLPVNAIISPINIGVRVIGLESAKTLDCGTLSTESGGVAAGFISAISLAAAVSVMAKSAATATRGSLVGGATLDRGHVVVSATQSFSYTLSTGTTTAHGVIILPYTLPFGF